MNREADAYENQVSEWLAQLKSLLYMFTDVISSRPELMEDYDSAVRWLNDVARHYPEISGCYMANPYAEHPVIMNTGWEPGEDDRPETRPWYRATERSADGFSISAPYLDAQTGTYCITFSRVVYGEQGEFLGIFGIGFFLDNLILVLGESYTSRSYAFLVDSEGIIINHPYDAYQMGENTGTSIGDTEYADACSRGDITAVRDYSGRIMACLSRRMDFGFTVLVADRWWDIYGSVVLVTVLFLILFGACLSFIVSMINRLIRWQAEVNRQLTDAAEAAKSANRAKSCFLSQMSHEIRTPMNAIIGLDSLALCDESISPQTRQSLEKIGSSAQHLLALINDILDMSRFGGSGLGMAITRSIVEMMDGEIGVESERGLGTTFTVSVRLGRVQSVQAAEVPAEEAPVEDISLEGQHILIAEDQAMNAEILTDLLELEDMSSEWAENGRLAVELFAGSEERHFDAILMDMLMPVMDGLGATEAIRKLDRPDARTIPIIALTANAFEEDVKQCLQAGMDALLSKPVDIEKPKDTRRRLRAANG